MATVLDDEDLVIQLERAIDKLNEFVYLPRSVLFKQDSIVPGTHYLIDITNLCVEVPCKAYYPPNNVSSSKAILPEVGILPLIISGGGSYFISNFSNFAFYQQALINISKFARQANLDGDFEILPPDNNGVVYLQIKNPGTSEFAFWLEYLPYLDSSSDSWNLFSQERAFVLDLAYYYSCEASIEYTDSAEVLGIKPSSKSQNYTQKIDKLIEQFNSSSLLVALY